ERPRSDRGGGAAERRTVAVAVRGSSPTFARMLAASATGGNRLEILALPTRLERVFRPRERTFASVRPTTCAKRKLLILRSFCRSLPDCCRAAVCPGIIRKYPDNAIPRRKRFPEIRQEHAYGTTAARFTHRDPRGAPSAQAAEGTLLAADPHG